MFSALINPPWALVFGVSLSLALFAVKLTVARAPKFDDLVVGAADIPTVLTASACSLLVAAAANTSDWRSPASQFLWMLIVFVVNVCLLRFVEKRKRSFSSSIVAVSAAITISLILSIFIALNIASQFYEDIGR